MSNIARKIKKEREKQIIYNTLGKKAKHRCPKCHHFTLWILSKDKRSRKCIMCENLNRKDVAK